MLRVAARATRHQACTTAGIDPDAPLVGTSTISIVLATGPIPGMARRTLAERGITDADTGARYCTVDQAILLRVVRA